MPKVACGKSQQHRTTSAVPEGKGIVRFFLRLCPVFQDTRTSLAEGEVVFTPTASWSGGFNHMLGSLNHFSWVFSSRPTIPCPSDFEPKHFTTASNIRTWQVVSKKNEEWFPPKTCAWPGTPNLPDRLTSLVSWSRLSQGTVHPLPPSRPLESAPAGGANTVCTKKTPNMALWHWKSTRYTRYVSTGTCFHRHVCFKIIDHLDQHTC